MRATAHAPAFAFTSRDTDTSEVEFAYPEAKIAEIKKFTFYVYS